ncbi:MULTISPECIES: type II toxin-antitoxin system RelE/ParE family toxin [unclassified Bradyrhizobium]|jgi:toxin ParE1/3/4|uniref:type II toxin-antitoxin system RelE/ParE family toxin n=1 Tax=unclassified Bradyrhizobium TaxID=2631580 RepID=UPI001FF80333|nr:MULTISPECIES: type II toxin-antitoxin system RelE/ParE family toxin [unclassified Bradyrhizobium]MCK1367569.1 type II toxin-antitoxin system RelE/ParE family toxin [Bradyrhizobium sp. 62]MCK1409861.1 type II toxin-antitoxin system RelE/ParE family toxin [Bradyrhizobium sp. 76]
MKVVWTREALADLADIATYYASNASPVVAEAVGRRFVDVVERVLRAPFSAPRVAHRSEVRVAAVVRYPFRIFYRVRGDVIHIVHIRHTSRRPVAGLNEPGRQYA